MMPRFGGRRSGGSGPAVVIALSCKEAVYKACGGPGGMHELSLTMYGHGASGWAVPDGSHAGLIVASWEVAQGSILTLAVASEGGGWHLLERIRAGRGTRRAQ